MEWQERNHAHLCNTGTVHIAEVADPRHRMAPGACDADIDSGLGLLRHQAGQKSARHGIASDRRHHAAWQSICLFRADPGWSAHLFWHIGHHEAKESLVIRKRENGRLVK